jgi:hypothetical protein
MNTQIQPGDMPEGGNFAGVWFTNWGEMTIEVNGNTAVGQFCDEDNNRYGRMEGTVRGNVLRFSWHTNDVSMGNRARTSDGSAVVQLTITPQGESTSGHIQGTWGFARSNDGGGPLRGDRSGHRSVRFLSGSYTMACAIRDLAEGGPPLSTAEVEDNPEDDGGSVPEDLSGGGDEGGGGDEEPLEDFDL